LVPAVLVLLVGALAYDQAGNVIADVQEVGRSHSVIEGSEALLVRAVDAETGQRAYLLTGNETFLDPYRGARADIDRSLDSLRQLTRGEPAQAARLTTIARVVPERFALLDSGINLRRRGAITEAASADRLMAGKKKMDQLRSLVADLSAHEQGLLAQGRRAEEEGLRDAAFAVGLPASWRSWYSGQSRFLSRLGERDSANAALRTVNEDLDPSKRAEEQAVGWNRRRELETTAEDLRTTNDELSRTTTAAEEARDLAEDARQRLERVLDNLPDAATVFDSQWRWTYVNPSAARILLALGIDPSQAIGEVLWDLLPDLKGTRFETETLRAVRESTVVEYEVSSGAGCVDGEQHRSVEWCGDGLQSGHHA
jgi:CHASE3 domain sensor protein